MKLGPHGRALDSAIISNQPPHRASDERIGSRAVSFLQSQSVRRRGNDGKESARGTHEGKWAVKGKGSKRATSIHDTQAEATARARDLARRQKSELLVHGRDGEIRARDSFGHDPYPPKG
jgi:hypothetical protein